MSVMKLYHFCAMRQGDQPGTLSYFDGTVTADVDLGDAAQYQRLKREIGEKFDTQAKGAEGLILLSLTRIGETPNV